MFTSAKSLKFLLTGFAVIGLLTACAEVFEDEETGETVQVGVMFPLSGEEAAIGLPAQKVMQIAVDEINKAGGVDGKNLELVFEDGACNSDQANKAMKNLVEVKKVKVVIGGFCSSETLAAAPIAEASKVVLFSPGSSNPKITEAGDFIFRNYPSDKAQAEVLSEYASKKGYKKVGLIVEEQPYTEGIADVFIASFKAAGGDTVTEKYAKDASDFRTQITKLQAAGVDLFFVDPQTPAKAGIIVKQLQEAGVKGPFLLNDVALGAQKEVLEPFKDYVEASVGGEVPYDKASPDVAALVAEYASRSNGEKLGYMTYMMTTYDSVYIIKEAIQAAGLDAVKVKDYLYTVKGRKGLAGTLSLDSNGDPTPDYRHALRVVKSGVVEDYVE